MIKHIMGWALIAALAGCGGSSAEGAESQDDGEGHAGGEADGHVEEGEGGGHPGLPGAVHAFHEVLAPIWHSEEGDARGSAACDGVHTLDSAADDVQAMSVPEGVDETAWHAATDDLAADVDAIAGACEGGGAEAEAKLAELHDAFHAIVDLLGQGHGEGEGAEAAGGDDAAAAGDEAAAE